MSINRILVPLDGSENAEKIGGWVAGLARPLDAEVVLVTVVNPDRVELPDSTPEHGHPVPGRPGPHDRPGIETTGTVGGATDMIGGATVTPGRGESVPPAPGFGTQVLDRALEEANSYIDQEVDRMNAAGVKVTGKAVAGDAAEEIIKYADEINADLIAMATHRGSALARGVLGSVTDRVLRGAGRPVMAVHPESLSAFSGEKGQPESILVPLDGSERSASVVDLALEVAKSVGAEVVFFRVVQFPYYGVTAVDASFYDPSLGMSHQQAEAQEYLDSFKERATEMGVSARTVVTTGAPAAMLLDQAKELPSPLIIMSTRGESGFKRWVMGSVTDKVIRSSGLPVLVVPPADKS